MARCCDYFREQGRTSNPARYRRLWEKGILPYMQTHGISLYTSEIGKAYLTGLDMSFMTSRDASQYLCSIRVLDDMMKYGKLRSRSYSAPRCEFSGEIGGHIESFLKHSHEIRRSKSTIASYKSYLYRFYEYVTELRINGINGIRVDHILDFIGTYPTMSKDGVLKTIRVMFAFWHGEGLVTADVPLMLKGMRCTRPKRLPSYFTPEDIAKIEASIERSSAVGKCNYAMILLASRLGLRISDIVSMEFGNIDWDNNTIRKTTQKTGKHVELPLLPDIGDAIIDYLRNGRPKSDSHRIFLSSRPPYGLLRPSTAAARIKSCISASGVNVDGRKHGPHSLRHSLANAMLANGAKMPTISEVLAHRNTQSTMNYLRIDMKEQSKCALEVPPVDDSFYNQRNRFFYENTQG